MENLLCPSFICNPGAQLYGIVNREGFTDYLRITMYIDEKFVGIARQGREPEKRFRFAGKCIQSGCKQWNAEGNACGLVDNIIDLVQNIEQEELQPCPIRKECRWFAQRKGLACAQCSEVIRNIETSMLADATPFSASEDAAE